jgi:hypothetical protein
LATPSLAPPALWSSDVKKTFCLLALVAAVALPAAAANAADPAASSAHIAVAGKMLYTVGGKAVGAIYSVQPDGSAQIMLDDHLVTVPASTITLDGGKLTTSLTRAQLSR